VRAKLVIEKKLAENRYDIAVNEKTKKTAFPDVILLLPADALMCL
jgi:hypothetical protein